jgi:hypothetical protein
MRIWDRIPVRGTPMARCGALASQTHISIVAGNGHEFYTKNAGQKGSVQGQEQRDRIAASISEL